MGACTAEVETSERGAIASPAREGSEKEQAVGCHGAVEDVAARQPEDGLEVGGRQHLPVEDPRGEAWGHLVYQSKDPISEGLSEMIPGRFLRRIGNMLHEERGDVPAGGRDARIQG